MWRLHGRKRVFRYRTKRSVIRADNSITVKAIKDKETGKTPGSSGIRVEMLKISGNAR